ncbi:MAG: glutamate--cysteine ligase [Phycisphaerales bacterium]|nr:glutamate--cysteine ligase [Phycisphaerales bacterium]
MGAHPYGLFEVVGIELEYMIVDAATLDVLPVVDRVLEERGGASARDSGEVGVGGVTWSNELVLHVVEFKSTEPMRAVDAGVFQDSVGWVEGVLAGLPERGRMLPTGMHPWMDPSREMRLWPHDNGEVYRAFDRVFDCRGHGWANLQSVHMNLPFRDDARADGEFGRLHAAVRLLLPIMPALAASSPVMDGRVTGTLDNRMAVYKGNARRVPAVGGRVIPEAVFTRADYEREILGRIYADMRGLDPDGVLRHEWCNARGAIARFGRGSIEVRVLDVQECPAADMAIAGAVLGALRALTEERWGSLGDQQAWEVEPLAAILDATIRDGERAMIENAEYLRAFGWGRGACAAGELWRHLARQTGALGGAYARELSILLDRGPLARRILEDVGSEPSRSGEVPRELLREVYGRLADCLRDGRMFVP